MAERVIVQSVIREAVESFMDSQHCTLWGRHYDIISPEGRAQAVAFLTNAVEEVINHVDSQQLYAPPIRRAHLIGQSAADATAEDQYSAGPVRKVSGRKLSDINGWGWTS